MPEAVVAKNGRLKLRFEWLDIAQPRNVQDTISLQIRLSTSPQNHHNILLTLAHYTLKCRVIVEGTPVFMMPMTDPQLTSGEHLVGQLGTRVMVEAGAVAR